jgi:hypothetical protein
MSKIKWYSDGQLGDEESFDINEDSQDSDVYLTIGEFSVPIKMDMNFEAKIDPIPIGYQYTKYFFRDMNWGRAFDTFEKEISFVGKSKDDDYSNFVNLFDKHNGRLDSLVIEKVDNIGIRKLNLHGVRMTSRCDYSVNIICDYWREEYV